MNTIRVQLAAALRKLATLQRQVELQPDGLVQEAIDELLRALEDGIRPRERASLSVAARVVTHATEEGLELHWVLRPLG